MATVALPGGAAGARAVLLVGNANASGVGSRPRVLESAVEALQAAGARVEPHLTESSGELGSLLELAGGRRVVALGGDGSLHALANLPEPPEEVAILPAGGANNIARSLGIPADLGAAARLAVEGRARPLDGIAARGAGGRRYTARGAGGRRYTALEGVSAGFLAQARTRFGSTSSADLKEGLRSGLAELSSFRPVELRLALDGEAETVSVSQLFVANLPRYAFGLRVAHADPRDGLLDVALLRTRTRLGLVAALARLRRGTLALPARRAEHVLLQTDGSPVVADSTNLGSGTIELRARPDALRVVAP